MPLGWILPNDGYGCGYSDLKSTVDELNGLGIKTGLWTQKKLDQIKQEVIDGIRVYKLDVAWTGLVNCTLFLQIMTRILA
ncbi:hypothetical protein P781_08740 [Vibrio mimicus CAIM 1883]|nr:hypothetical protein P781_08740 [Vibrio mimicus CAIM 1883]